MSSGAFRPGRPRAFRCDPPRSPASTGDQSRVTSVAHEYQPIKLEERAMSTTEIPVDVGVLRAEIQKTYTEVSTEQEKEFIFPTGRAWAQYLGYPEPELSRVPDASVESFAGVANHWLLGRA